MTTRWLPGDWAVVAGRSPISWTVDQLEKLAGGRGRFTHAIQGVEKGMIVEAEPDGAVMRPMHYDDDQVIWSTGRLPPELTPSAMQREVICASARRYAGVPAHKYRPVPYSFADYLAIAAHYWHVPAPGLREFVADSHHMICSQLVDQCQRDAGITLFGDGRWPGFVPPFALAGLLGAH